MGLLAKSLADYPLMDVLSHALRGAIVASPGKMIYCVDPDTLVLKQDLAWASAKTLTSGQELLAFDENSGHGKGNQRKFRPATVLASRTIQRPRLRIKTTQGEITVSTDHQFLARQHKHQGGWTAASDLRIGTQLAFLSKPWAVDGSQDGGYLAGFLDGEGHVGGHRVGWAQNRGVVFDKICRLLNERDFDYHVNQQGKLGKVDIGGGLSETLRILGSIRPVRLLAASQRVWDGRRIWGQTTPIASVLEILPVQNGPVVAITTSTGTLITQGFLSHNCADYASIEARVVMWLAGEEHGLELFRTGADIYCDMASDIYGYPVTKAHTKERGMGKIAILGLGYQMGAAKFQAQCALQGQEIDDEFAQQVVTAYREKYATIRQLWYDQEDAAITAVRRGTHRDARYTLPVQAGLVHWQLLGRFLYCTLPSGRRLAYPDAKIQSRITPWGAEKPALTYKGVNGFAHQWQRQHAYGGMLVENITQAISRDILADALIRCEKSDIFTPILTCHDEIIAEGEPGLSVKQFEQLVSENPSWGSGIPIAAEGWSGARYRK